MMWRPYSAMQQNSASHDAFDAAGSTTPEFNEQNPCICFIHLPKAAGTTVINVFPKLFDGRQIFGHAEILPTSTQGLRVIAGHHRFYDFERIVGPKLYMTCLRRPLSRLLSTYRFWRSIDPARLLDMGAWVALKVKDMSFSEFVKSSDSDFFPILDNNMVRTFSGADEQVGNCVTEDDFEEACANISKFEVILFQESLSEDIFVYFRQMGACISNFPRRYNDTNENCKLAPSIFSPVNNVEVPTDPTFVAALTERTAFDQRLYNFAIALRERRGMRVTRLSSIQIQYPRLAQGEKLAFGSDRFVEMLGDGWEPRDPLCAWTVADKASVRFAVNWRSRGGGVVRLRIAPCMLPGRRMMDLALSVNGEHRRNVVFLENSIQMKRAEFQDDFDTICIGDAAFFFDLPLHESPNAAGGYEIIFDVGPRASPSELGFNDDIRELGVRLEYISVLSVHEASEPCAAAGAPQK